MSARHLSTKGRNIMCERSDCSPKTCASRVHRHGKRK